METTFSSSSKKILNQYKGLTEILDNFIIAMKLCGHEGIYCDARESSYSFHKTHVFNVWTNKCCAFSFSINRKPFKAKFDIAINNENFNARSFSHKLKKAGIMFWDQQKSKNGIRYYNIYCYDNILQLEQILNVFSDYII